MRILIAYATTEGQTRRICRRASEFLGDMGHIVEMLPVSEDTADTEGRALAHYDRVILAGSVHVSKIQEALVKFARSHAAQLSQMPVLYLQVSLSAASTDPQDQVGLDQVTQTFCAEIGWTPQRIEQIAGAFRFTQYDFFRSWAMRWIASQKDSDIDTHGDTEYTDWDALQTTLADWVVQ